MSLRKIIVPSIVALAIIGGVAYFFIQKSDGEPQYRTARVQSGDIDETISATGTVNAVVSVLVGTQVSGTIRELYADFNSTVRRGQVIALIDPATFEAQVEQSRANLQVARANLEKAETSRIDAERTLKRNKELFERDLIARSEFDTAQTNHDNAIAQVSASRAQIAQAEAALKFAETNLRYTRILSPVDGIVVSRNVDIGQTVAASFQTPTLFTIAQDLTKMQIETNVDEADIGRAKVDQEVEFTVDAYPDKTFKGRVSQVRNAPINVQNVVTYIVVIKVDNPDLLLKPGMTTNVSIITSRKTDVLKIPKAALRFSPPEKGEKKAEQKGNGVWILKDSKPVRIKITTGISDGTFMELVSGDLKEGQEVITESLKKTQNSPSSSSSSPPRGRMF